MKFAIYGQSCQTVTIDIVIRMMSVLEKHKATAVFEECFYQLLLNDSVLEDKYQTFSKTNDLDNSFNFFIGIGGDGTMIRAANLVNSTNIPILGINAGRLGFLATVQQESIEDLLPLLFTSKFRLSKRILLSLNYSKETSDKLDMDFALNEITVSRKDSTSMITIETHLNGEYLTSYWADGLIISTPSGSTGYSLSCGGPIITPQADCLIITPVAPHNLNVRPLVINSDTKIKLVVSSREPQHLISQDSITRVVDNKTEIYISKAKFTINMIEFAEQSFIKTLRNKLLWGEDKRN